MSQTKSINYSLVGGLCFLLFVVYSLLSASPAQSIVEITLTWSTDTYVPLNYPGKPLPSKGSLIEVAANVDSPGLNPQDLTYNWFFDGRSQTANSGQGQQVFRFNIGQSTTNEHLVKVQVKNSQGTYLGSSSYLSIKAYQPEIVLETKIPSLESYDLTQKYQIRANQEVDFTAQPYFFNIESLNELDCLWTLDQETASLNNLENPHILTLKIDQLNQPLKRTLNLWAENRNNPLQKAQVKAEITFMP